MKKLFAVLLVSLMLAAAFAGCTNTPNTPDPTEAPVATDAPATEAPATEAPATEVPATDEPVADNTVNLMDMYTVTDPEGVEYDQRTALYMPYIEGSEEYNAGMRYSFMVFYGKDGQGVYLYTVSIFDTEENAAAYAAQNEVEADGTAVVMTNDATFFAAMSAFIPDLQTWIDNNMMSGYMELD